MSTNRLDDVGGSARQAGACPNDHIVEVAFLLPDWQVAALETAAHGDCLTCGQLVRRLIRDFLGQKNRLDSGITLTSAAPFSLMPSLISINYPDTSQCPRLGKTTTFPEQPGKAAYWQPATGNCTLPTSWRDQSCKSILEKSAKALPPSAQLSSSP